MIEWMKNSWMNRWADRWMDGWMERWTHRQTDIERGWMNWWKDRHPDKLSQTHVNCGEFMWAHLPLTGAGLVVFGALLRMSLQPALEAVLPELREPGVPEVRVRLQVQVVIIKPCDVSRLQLDSDSPCCLPLEAVSDIIAVRPTITAKCARDKWVMNGFYIEQTPLRDSQGASRSKLTHITAKAQ